MKHLFSLLGIVTGLKHSERRAFTCRGGHFQIRKSSSGDVCNVNIDEVGRFYLFNSNGIPDHDTSKSGAVIKPQNIKLAIPKHPITLQEPECVGQGIVGVALNGVPIFNARGGDCCDNAIKLLEDHDGCNGYTSPNGIYRYHIYPICLQKCVFQTASGILGVALDGFPIYGPVDDDGAQLTSRDLDECHGKWHGSEYRYHVTADYPYFISCFRGRVPAQNKQTPVRRGRGRRSTYSWREGARLPDFDEGTFQLPLKMGDCKVCRNVNSCFGKSQTYSSYVPPSEQSSFLPTQPITARLEPRKKPMTRTLDNAFHYTPHKTSNNAPQSPPNFEASNAQGNLQVQRNKKSLFSLYRPQTTSRSPFLKTTDAPMTMRAMTLPRNPFSSILSQRVAATNRNAAGNAHVQHKGNNHFKSNMFSANPSFETTKPATSLKGMLNNIIHLKNSNVATPQEAREHLMSTQTWARQELAGHVDFESMLESLRTGPGMRWKNSDGSPVFTNDELRQMLEDAHVTKVAERRRIDPLIALLENEDDSDTKIEISKKSALGEAVGANAEANAEALKIRDATSLHKNKLRSIWNKSLSPKTISPLRPKSTRAPTWHKFTSTVKPWVREVSNRMSQTPTQSGGGKLEEYIMINGVRQRIPDNIRHLLEMQRQTAVPKNMHLEAAREVNRVQSRNSYLKSAFGKRRRRGVGDVELIDAIIEVRRSQGKYNTGFLMRKEGQMIIKCEAPSFKTPSPHQVNPKHLSPKLLELMLKERKDVVRVKQSALSRLFNN